MSAGLLAATFLTVYVTNDLHDGYNREAYNRLHAQKVTIHTSAAVSEAYRSGLAHGACNVGGYRA